MRRLGCMRAVWLAGHGADRKARLALCLHPRLSPPSFGLGPTNRGLQGTLKSWKWQGGPKRRRKYAVAFKRFCLKFVLLAAFNRSRMRSVRATAALLEIPAGAAKPPSLL